ncbi:putative sulfate/molybdate transporter [Halostella litorea]|uniref:putative sulfate/molybdate transporter n=1 Tax=Halostella litorea TaxID=2528831 RepID=UPI001091F116|nr:putative sulfate/molybdate transporter [Halostella litorea]
MATSTDHAVRDRLAFTAGEVTGALGDSVTVLPIVVALGATTAVSLPHVLLLFGAFQVVWGLVYGLPLSVEPMKALAGLAIAGALTAGELAAAGLVAGVALLALGAVGALDRIESAVGRPVVRGIQLAVALLLLETGLSLGAANLALAGVGAGVALVAVVARRGRASALAVLAVGAAIAVAEAGVPSPAVPELAAFASGTPTLSPAALEGAAAQLAMTVGNAAVATAVLCADLFDRDVSPDDLSTSMGAMTLSAVPLGGIPMCHGSGGLAGKYAFGARTGGANVVLGVLYVAVALVAGGGLVMAYPTALLGVLLVVVAWQLGRAAAATDDYLLTAAVGVAGLLINVGVAFVAGALAFRYLR